MAMDRKNTDREKLPLIRKGRDRNVVGDGLILRSSPGISIPVVPTISPVFVVVVVFVVVWTMRISDFFKLTFNFNIIQILLYWVSINPAHVNLVICGTRNR